MAFGKLIPEFETPFYYKRKIADYYISDNYIL